MCCVEYFSDNIEGSVAKGRKTFREHSLRLCCSQNVFEMAVPKCQMLNYLLGSKSKLCAFWTRHFKHSFEHSASARLTSPTARAAARSRFCARRFGLAGQGYPDHRPP